MNPDGLCLSVIMVLHNSGEALSNSVTVLAEELKQLQKSNPSYQSEALFVDNASDSINSSESAETINRHLQQGRMITLVNNVGFGAGCNVGAREARGEYLLFLNPDVILDSGAILELIKTLKKKDNAWAASGRMRNADGSFQATCRELPTKLNIFGSRGSTLSALLGSKSVGYTLPDYQTTTEVPATAATALMIKREVFAKLGGFDERFFMFMEDTDISAEIEAQGGKIYFCPQAGALHYWGAGSQASASKRSRWHHLSVWRYYRKRLPGFFSNAVLPLALLTNFIISACVSALKGNK